ncbi:tlde1 domain-containing protein [Erwinia sp. BNK-24-b]|uniref:tlde1 domain-containing protein n=1 Tax=unclassified Erwinia TaxID=2622719 RepID=UPI0039BFBAEB
MSWIYNVMSKSFYLNGKFQFNAMYAGAPGYKDDVKFECIKNKGPLPRGKYRITGPIATHPTAGRYVLRLIPYKGNNMCGRDGFLIHGGNGKGTASNGCIVLQPKYREKIIQSGDSELIVL